MRTKSGLWISMLLCLFLFQTCPSQAAGIMVEGFDLGMTEKEADDVATQKKLKLYYENLDTPGRVSRSYDGHLLDGNEGTLDLVFKDGKLLLITATLEGGSPEMQQLISRKYQELDDEYRKAYGETTESSWPGSKDWILPDRVVTLYKTDGKMFITVVSRGNMPQE